MTFDQHIQLWNVVGTWVAGVATFLAVLVSLHLARRQDQPRVAIRAEVLLAWFEKGSEKNREYLSVYAVNVGDRPVTISHLSLRFGLLRKLWVAVPIPDQEVSSPFPTELTYGKEAKWLIPLENDDFKWRESIASFLADSYRHAPIRFASVYATSTTGRVFKANSDSSVAAAFNRALRKLKHA